uniref:Integrin alpha first immunoglubulin-like domain-containing protein n=1 Tax=Gouania willdenowi TaxID=441366 RepID=A0A8C5DEX9_GOUWI
MCADVQSCGKTCEAESDHQWLGVSLSRQPGESGGHVLACAHRWKNVYYSQKDPQNNKLPHGVCYRYGADLRHPRPIIPCYRDHQRKFGGDYGSCQAGISNFLTEDLIIMGAPGTFYWMGSVLVYNTSNRRMSVYLDDDSGVFQFGSYLGYSVGAGHFQSSSSVEVVGGAPQYNKRGKSVMVKISACLCRAGVCFHGRQQRTEGCFHSVRKRGETLTLGSYFGSSVCAVDLNADDVAIGAPQEDDLKGAVYIYNGREEGISPTPSQRISGSSLGRDLRMFGQSLSSGIDIDDNDYQDVAVGAFLSDSAVVLRTRPVIQVKASLTLPEQIDQQASFCQDHKTVCFNVTLCFSVRSRRFRGAIDLQYKLTSDLLHKPSFPHRFYFHGNGSSNSTKGRVRAGQSGLTCATHVAYQRKDLRDIFTPVQFEVSYALRESNHHKASSKTFPPLKPILQQNAGHRNTIMNQVRATHTSSYEQQYFALGSGHTIILKASLVNSGDDAFLPRLKLQFPQNIHYIKVLQNVILNPIKVCFLLSDNYEKDEFLHDNSVSLVLPLKYGVKVNIHGFVSPTSFVFGDEDLIPADCYPEKFNYTYKVLNSGPSRSVNTVVDIALPKILAPYRHRLLQVVDWQVCL